MKLDELRSLRDALARSAASDAASDAASEAGRLRAARASPPPTAPSPAAPLPAATPVHVDDFRRHVGEVAPLRTPPRATRARKLPEPVPRQRLLDERAALASSHSDEFDVETLLDTDDNLSFRRDGIGPDVPRRLRRGDWALQAQIDLHGLTRDEAREALAAFVADASRRGCRCVRVVHGKGSGSPGQQPVLKSKVRAWLVQHDRVIAFVQAPRAQGGHGALLVLLT